ncbi:MAG TPA: mannosyltransferase family protein [Actinocrinis sp.]|uniref:mannosyltransferase family protein n=1 Tax=Actinocrinis sp. TaxID=1920516 RepID=UPI002D42AC26|nr:mannosyltransferase family protein [Actinocrinis sp.]HZU54680.1 mannosyltransferase family protein [Actinocrinis sp.]
MDSDVRVLGLEAGPAEASAVPRRRLTRSPWWTLDPLRTRFGLGAMEADALRVWLISRIGMVLITWAVIWTGWGATTKQPRGWASMWQRWDWLRFYDIAAHGYSLRARHGASIAFFPGYPGLLYAVHLVFRSWVYSGLLISLVAGAIAAIALARIIALEAAHLGEPEARSAVRDGVTLFVWAPAAVFLAAGYSEAPFLAFTLWAWLAARRERWMAAGLLLAGAATIRVNGLFVLAAVGVLFLQSRPRTPRAWLRGGWLLVPLLPVAGYMAYLHSLTGNWNAWERAERLGWNRHLSYPWHTFANTWHYAFGRYLTAHESWEYQLEIAVTLLGIGLVVWLGIKRRWAEFVYALLSVGTLATSHVYLSVPREMLTWWPLWAALAVWCVRRPWVRTVYLTVSAPVMFTVAYLFLTGRWAG